MEHNQRFQASVLELMDDKLKQMETQICYIKKKTQKNENATMYENVFAGVGNFRFFLQIVCNFFFF